MADDHVSYFVPSYILEMQELLNILVYIWYLDHGLLRYTSPAVNYCNMVPKGLTN
jgi:hypothetical protein